MSSYWNRLFILSFHATNDALGISGRGPMVIGAILALFSLAIVWSLGGAEQAAGDIYAKVAYTSALVLIYPLVFCFNAVRLIPKMDRDAADALRSARAEVEALRKYQVSYTVDHAVVRDSSGKVEAVLSVRNHGVAAHFLGRAVFPDVPASRGGISERWRLAWRDYLGDPKLFSGEVAEVPILALVPGGSGWILTRDIQGNIGEFNLFAQPNRSRIRFTLELLSEPAAEAGPLTQEYEIVFWRNEQTDPARPAPVDMAFREIRG